LDVHVDAVDIGAPTKGTVDLLLGSLVIRRPQQIEQSPLPLVVHRAESRQQALFEVVVRKMSQFKGRRFIRSVTRRTALAAPGGQPVEINSGGYRNGGKVVGRRTGAADSFPLYRGAPAYPDAISELGLREFGRSARLKNSAR